MQVVVDGILTNYQVVGEKKEKIFLILHGWKRSLPEWVPVATELTGKYQVILLDLPGFGQTALPQKIFSIYDYALFVEHFLDKLDVGKMTVLGHSFGGRIGIILGAKTKRLEKLILVDAAGIEKRSIFAKIKILLFKSIKLFLPKNLVEKLRSSVGSSDYKTAGNLREIFVKVINEDLTNVLERITPPTLLIWGERDTEVPIGKAKQMKAMIPKVKLRIVWGAGHSPYLEKPQEFMGILQEELGVSS